MDALVVRPSVPDDWRSALSLLYAHLTPRERDLQVEGVLSGRGGQLLDGLIVGEQNGRIVAAMLCVWTEGRTAMVWPPRLSEAGDADAVRAALMTKLKQQALDNKVRLAQALLTEEDADAEPAFLAAGFFYLARLIYLRRYLSPEDRFAVRPDVEYVSYSLEVHDELLNVLEQTYEESRDCPELNGARELQEVFDSHKAQGVFDPAHWMLARRDGRWVGCLLLTGIPDLDALEIAYVGVVPPARGLKLGTELTAQALRVAQSAGCSQVTLAVDARNTPALRMYDACGFGIWDERDAYLMMIDPADGVFERWKLGGTRTAT